MWFTFMSKMLLLKNQWKYCFNPELTSLHVCVVDLSLSFWNWASQVNTGLWQPLVTHD